jgi:hypothetical protein
VPLSYKDIQAFLTQYLRPEDPNGQDKYTSARQGQVGQAAFDARSGGAYSPVPEFQLQQPAMLGAPEQPPSYTPSSSAYPDLQYHIDPQFLQGG